MLVDGRDLVDVAMVHGTQQEAHGVSLVAM